jgi:hypothetical protein
MRDVDPFAAERLMYDRVREEHQRADARRLAQQVQPSHHGAVSRQLRWPVCQLGYRLVSLGAWLEQQSMAQPPQLEAKPSRGR